MDTSNNIIKFFEEKLRDIKCQDDTRAYIAGIYGKYKSSDLDLSKDSITLLYSQARLKQDFLIYQNLGDWLFFINTIAPTHLRYASKEYYDTIAQLSYYSCYRLMNKKWKLFEELSNNLISLEEQVKNKLTEIAFQ
jgi:hypothetical protein